MITVIQMNGFVLVDKEKNMTSFDVTRLTRRLLNADKAGHTGTLDPFAEGLMIICLGRATKLAYLFSGSEKSYHATVELGTHYDTYDVTGTPVRTNETFVEPNRLEDVLKSFVGGYQQVPPMYSAIKKDGKKLYDLARKGVEIERDPRDVVIHAITIDEPLKDGVFSFVTTVSKGTYIRSLAVDIASELGTYGALRSLTRLSVGPFRVHDAKRLDALTTNDIIPIETLFESTPKVRLEPYIARLARHGVKLDDRQTSLKEAFVATDEQEKWIAYYEPEPSGAFRPIYMFEERS